MSNEKHLVHLTETERKKLLAVISKGRNKAVVIQRAHILLKVDEGKPDAEISQMLYVSEQTIRRTRLRYEQEGMQAALDDRPHPSREPKLDEKQEAHLIALACSTPPAGQAQWTLELLTKQLMEEDESLRVSPETVRLLLKKTNSSLGK
jgi:transposase